MFLRRTSRQKLEVSLDEPLNTDWDGNELLLSDILGTEGDMVYRSIEETVERQMLARALSSSPQGKRGDHAPALRAGRLRGKDAEAGGGYHGHQPELYLRLEKRILNRLQKGHDADGIGQTK